MFLQVQNRTAFLAASHVRGMRHLQLDQENRVKRTYIRKDYKARFVRCTSRNVYLTNRIIFDKLIVQIIFPSQY